MRKPIIVGNWKMNKLAHEAEQFVKEVDDKLHDKADFGIAPSYLALVPAKKAAKNLIVAAQNCHFADSGAYTGEVAVDMLLEHGIDWVILGHSERRQYNNETDEAINKKAQVCLDKNVTPIICVGETLAQFEANETEKVVRHQVKTCLANLKGDLAKIVIAYEPVWAIGTGKSATMEIAQNTCALVRDEIKNVLGEELANQIRIQYGGSVKPENIADYLAQADIDGALVGGASLKVDSFLALVAAVK